MRFWTFPLLALTLAAQTPSFEVASVRPTGPPTRGSICGSYTLSPETVLSTESLPSSNIQALIGLLNEAYRDEVEDFDVPQWTLTGPFAVNVRIPPNTSVRTCRKMLQNLLAERFHAVTAVETLAVPRYHLKVAKSGLKLKPVSDPPDDPDASVNSEVVGSGRQRYTFRGASALRIFTAIRTAVLLRDNRARAFGADAGFRVPGMVPDIVDEAGLTGYYDGEFEYTLPASPDEFPQPESIEDALTRQLGLTVELRKVPGKVLVLRSADRTPTEN